MKPNTGAEGSTGRPASRCSSLLANALPASTVLASYLNLRNLSCGGGRRSGSRVGWEQAWAGVGRLGSSRPQQTQLHSRFVSDPRQKGRRAQVRGQQLRKAVLLLLKAGDAFASPGRGSTPPRPCRSQCPQRPWSAQAGAAEAGSAS